MHLYSRGNPHQRKRHKQKKKTRPTPTLTHVLIEGLRKERQHKGMDYGVALHNFAPTPDSSGIRQGSGVNRCSGKTEQTLVVGLLRRRMITEGPDVGTAFVD